ncbi:MAG: DUF2634 domain-containing protein [Firmicutes bacterium]|nr:DUF2634 domain-containing protein [[Eubacterium] siraeum]MCM1488574.1 DUF2634 domain-containing protein [Bacillota bacterium]
MIPDTAKNQLSEQSFETGEQPAYTYKMNASKERIQGYTDELEAVKQAVYKILLTERYGYVMYSGNYGTELKDLFGQPISYVCPELERRITEALTWDDRIDSVTDFEFDLREKGTVAASFKVNSIFGSFDAEREVKI